MTGKTFPAVHRQQYPGLTRVFDEEAAVNDSAFTSYIQSKTDPRVLITLVEDLFKLLDYTLIPVEPWDDVFDIVIRKGNSEYPIHTVCEGKPSLTALQQLTGAYTTSNVPHSILVSTVVPSAERTKRVAKHSGVRVIDHRELRELVQAAIARLSEPVPSPRSERGQSSVETDEITAQVDQSETAARQNQDAKDEVSPDEADQPTDSDSSSRNETLSTSLPASDQPTTSGKEVAESYSFIRSAEAIEDTPQHSIPVLLRIREHLIEDDRRHVFRANTIDGKSVQLDVWHRHIDEFDWELGDWYIFKSVRGQQWTVNGEAGVTVSTTPEVTVTQHESVPGSEVMTG